MNRKNYNSILFLTVYLGLVLVGGSAQVLAHAATNSLFDLRNEIEFKDDLDKKPEESCDELKACADPQETQFIEEFVKLVVDSIVKNRPNRTPEGSDGIVKDDFPSLSKDLSLNFFRLSFPKEGSLGKIDFKPTFEIKKTTHFLLTLDQIRHLRRNFSQSFSKKVVYEKKIASSENDQVFIVTRLPRGSIDSLLTR